MFLPFFYILGFCLFTAPEFFFDTRLLGIKFACILMLPLLLYSNAQMPVKVFRNTQQNFTFVITDRRVSSNVTFGRSTNLSQNITAGYIQSVYLAKPFQIPVSLRGRGSGSPSGYH